MSNIINEANTMGFPTGPVDSGKVTAGGAGGDWGGSMPKALEIAKIVSGCSGKSNPMSSQKRSRVKTASGNVSDHYEGNTSAYALDIPTSGTAGDKLLSCIMEKWNGGSNSSYKGGKWLNVNVGGYRYQFGWRVTNHYDHIHIGVKKIGASSEPTSGSTSNSDETQTKETDTGSTESKPMTSLTDFFRSAYDTLKSTGMGQKQIQEINEDVDRISEIIKKVL